ncbi:MAG: putative PEP-binding protein, partial [Pseudomonadota bacterium]
PALGWRAIRLSIDRPGLLRMQMRALLKAAAGRELKIKLPMITMVTEVDQVRALLDKEIAGQRQHGHELPSSIKLGAMIEVPSLLWQLDELMQRVDFVSVGSNDLFQFVAASDRTNSRLANRFSPMSRPFLRALREIARAAGRNKTAFQLCGELAGEPLSALALLGIGYRAISMPALSVGPIKEMVRSIDMVSVTHMVNEMVDDRIGSQTVTEVLTDYADQNGIPVSNA